MRPIKVLWLLLALTVAGCTRGANWDRADLERQAVTSFNNDAQQKGESIRCTSVSLVQESENRFTGFAVLSDGRKISVTTSIDPNDGRAISDFKPQAT